jgi:hypothetical protein
MRRENVDTTWAEETKSDGTVRDKKTKTVGADCGTRRRKRRVRIADKKTNVLARLGVRRRMCWHDLL